MKKWWLSINIDARLAENQVVEDINQESATN